jgi:outer membrane protein assembly factor BamA
VVKFEVKLFLVVALLSICYSVAFSRPVNTLQPDTLGRITIDSARLVTINRILIIGNKRTRDQIISRELSLKTSDTVRFYKLPEILSLDKRKIYNLRLFNTVTIRSLEMSYNTIDLLVEVDERWYTWPIPIFELSDRNFNEWWQNYNHDFGRVNYGLRLEQYNCRGRNETLKLTAQFGFAQRYELSYVIPYLDKRQKQGLILNFEFGALRNLAAQTIDHKIRFLPTDSTVLFDGNPILRNSIQAQATYTYRKSFFETHSFSVGYRANDIFDQVAVYNPNYFNNTTNKQKYTMLSYAFRSEHRDVVMYPLNGYQFSAHIQKNGLGWEGEVNQWILNLTHAYHHDLKKGYNLSNFCSLYLSDPMRQPYNLLGALGYQRQIVRGYEVYVIEGPKFFVNKTTFKKKIYSSASRWENMPLEQFKHVPFTIFWKAFADFGYVQNYINYEEKNQNTRLSDKLLAGAGTGVDIVLPYDIVFRLEYTFTREATQGFFFNLKKDF